MLFRSSPNAVPARCEMDIDIRFIKVNQLDDIKAKIAAICEKQWVEDTSYQLKYTSLMMPYETTEDVRKLYNYLADIADRFGFDKLNNKYVGGSSDASYLTMAGVPTLCSCGVRGEWNHTMKEYAIVDSLYERAKLFTTAILEIDK